MLNATELGAAPPIEAGSDLGRDERGLAAARKLIGEELRAAARFAGVTAVLAEASDNAAPGRDAGDGWKVDLDGTVTVSPEHFLARGDSPREAAYAVLVELWAVVREARRAPRVVARRRALAAVDPSLAPLLAGIVRAVAVWEVVTVLPGLRDLAEVRAARVLAQAGPLPRHLQYVGELTRAAFGAGRGSAAFDIDTDVRAEIADLRDFSGAGDAIFALLGPEATDARVQGTGSRNSTLRGALLDRQLAVFGPPYNRLLELDAAGRGVQGKSSRPVGDADDADPSPDELAPGHGGDDAQRADPAQESAADAPAVAPDTDQSEDAESADQFTKSVPRSSEDLFPLDRARFISTVLDSPLSANDALVEMLLAQAEDDRLGREDGDRDEASARARDTLVRQQVHASLPAYTRYAERLRAFAAPIERTRELWRRVIDERITVRRALGRRAHPDGEVLSPWALARAVIDAKAGVPSPAAFARYEERLRIGRAVGSTDYAFVIDRSGSMQGPAADAAADAVLVLLEALAGAVRDIREAESRIDQDLDLELRTALFVYDSEPLCVKPLSAHLGDDVRVRLYAEIRRVGGSTNDAAALEAVGAALCDPARRRIVIVISDGGSNDEVAASRSLARLRAAGVTVWGIGVNSDAVAMRYAPLSRRVDGAQQLVTAIQDLIEELI
jgi:hypothetical protein